MPLRHVVNILQHTQSFLYRLSAARNLSSLISFEVPSLFLHRSFNMSGAAAAPMGDHLINDPKPYVVFVLGAPGSGKGTQCPLIVRDFGYVHLSAGDLLRQERETPGSPYGEMILGHMKQGTIVPVEVTCSLLAKAMQDSGKTHFLIDGFPRNLDNQEGWVRQMSDTNLQFVLFLDAPKDLCVERCLVRGAVSGRPDDNVESLGKRFETYIKDTLPIIKYYDTKGLVRKVSTVPPPEEVHVEISSIFKAANTAIPPGGVRKGL